MSGPRNQTPDLSVCACGLHVLLLSALGSLFRNMHITLTGNSNLIFNSFYFQLAIGVNKCGWLLFCSP